MAYTAIFKTSVESASSSGAFTNLLSAGGLRQEVNYLQHFNAQLSGVNADSTLEAVFNLSFSKLRLLLIAADAPVQYSLDPGFWSVPARTHSVQLGASDNYTATQLKVRYAPVLITPPANVSFEVLIAGV